MHEPRSSGAPPSRGRRFIATLLCLLLVYALALNLLWEMWSETGTIGAAMNLSLWLFGVPGRWPVYMLLPWVHVIVAVVLCVWLHRAVAGAGRPAGGSGPSPFLAWGLLTIAASCSLAGLMALGQRHVERADAGQPPQLNAQPLQRDILSAAPLNRKSSAQRTFYVPLAPADGAAAEVRAVLVLVRPLRQELQPPDWAPPYTVRRLFAPLPSWVRGELARRGHRVAPGAVLVERVWLDAAGRPLAGAAGDADALIVAAIGSFCGLLLIGLDLLGRRA